MSSAVDFPTARPPGFEPLGDEPPFDAERHLQLEAPDGIVSLADLGYDRSEIDRTATPVAASTPFRVLSDEGAEIMLGIALRLRDFIRPAADRIERTVRGGCYRSSWLRDLCTDPDLTAHLASIYGIDVAPHPMGHQLGHLNYAPESIERAIDRWHHDTLPLDIVMAVTDPASVAGGRFEYFVGTKHEAADLAAAGRTPPRDRVVAPDIPGPGWAIALHGDMVVHRAGPLERPCERITMVNGYVATDTSLGAQSRCADLVGVDDPGALWVEWARFAAWRSSDRLRHLIDSLEFTDDRESVIASLEGAVDDITTAIHEMRSAPRPTTHYGG